MAEKSDLSETRLAILNLFKDDLWKRKKELSTVLPNLGFAVPHGDYEAQSVLMRFIEEAYNNNVKLAPEMELFIHRTLGASVVRNYSRFGSLERLLMDVAGAPTIYDVKPTRLEDIIVGWFRRVEVPVIVVTGFMGAGKTDFALEIASTAKDKLSYKVVTNVNQEGFDYVDTYKGLISYLQNTDGQKLFVYDEAGVSMDSRRSGSAVNVALSHFVLLARKFGAGILFLVQDEDIVDLRVRKFTNVLVHKLNKKRSRITELFGKEVNYELVNIDKTHVVYDTYDVAAFSLSPGEDKKYDAFKYLKK